MAKKSDPFDKFREATLGGGSPLSGALQGATLRSSERKQDETPSPLLSRNPKMRTANWSVSTSIRMFS